MEKDTKICPVCHKELELYQTNKDSTDYICREYQNEKDISKTHHYSNRVKEDKITKAKIRLLDNSRVKFYLKVYYDENYSEVWTDINSERATIHSIIDTDFSDIERLKTKIKTYLIFS